MLACKMPKHSIRVGLVAPGDPLEGHKALSERPGSGKTGPHWGTQILVHPPLGTPARQIGFGRPRRGGRALGSLDGPPGATTWI